MTNLFNVAPHLAKCHVFHFIGHGAFRRKSEHGEGTAALYLEKGDGAWQAVKDEEIVSMFTALGTLPHLVFLVACESARRDDNAETPFVGLGPKLVQSGIPAVVAMQEQVPVEMARVLSGEFYARLAEHGEVDRALNQARLQIFDARKTEWAIPVLFMRIRKGRLFGAEPDEDAPAPGEPPFKGLEYFGENDADKFYGRELLTAKLAGKLRLSRFLPIIIGASGSGKSSVIRAGLLPTLRRGTQLVDGTLPPEGSRSWMTYTFTPGAKPLDALAAALTRDEESATATTTLIDDLAIDKRSLHLRSLKLLSRRPDAQRLMLVVDQFEEIFTLTKDESERRAFINALMYASSEVTDGPTVVIIIFRADFYAHCSQYDNLREAVATQQEFVGPMNQAELRRAIEEPAKAGGWDMEPGLVDLILKEVGDEPGALPLMQHALLETWKRRRGHTMTLRGYNDAGGIRGAIAKTAEAIYHALPADQQSIARRIFLKLVELGEGTQDTRRRARLEELYPRADERPQVEGVLKKLVDNRLVVTTDKTAEVAHEALIREWPTLRGWINDSREALRLHRELLDAAEDWERVNRDEGSLYRGVRLAQALEWAAQNADEVGPLEKEFLAASKEFSEREAREKEVQRQRELEAAKRIAEEQQRAAGEAQKAQAAAEGLAEEQTANAKRMRARNRIITGVGIVAGVLAIAASVLFVFAQVAQNQAEEQRVVAVTARADADEKRVVAVTAQSQALEQKGIADANAVLAEQQKATAVFNEGVAQEQARLALAGELASQAKAIPETQLDLSLLLGVEAYNLEPGSARQGDLLSLLDKAPPLKRILRGHEAKITALEFNANHTWLASGDDRGTVILWNLTQENITALPVNGHSERVYDFAFRPDGQSVVSVADDGQLIAWDLATGQAINQVQLPQGGWALALSTDGRSLAVGMRGFLEIRDANSLEVMVGPAEDPNGETWMSLAFSPSGQRLISGGYNGQIVAWNALTLQPVQVLRGGGPQVSALAYDPSGTVFVHGDWDFFAQVWDAQTLQLAGSVPASPFLGRVLSLVFTDPGSERAQLWAGTSDNNFTLWDQVDGTVASPLDGYQGTVDIAAVSPDGVLAASNSDRAILVWHLGPVPPAGDNLNPDSHELWAWSVAVNPSGGTFATGFSDGGIQRFDVASKSPTGGVLSGHSNTVISLAYSVDGKYLASASTDGTVRLWEAATGNSVGDVFGQHADVVRAVAFSPDSTRLATGGFDRTLRLWSVPDGNLIWEAAIDNTVIYDLAFSPDGTRVYLGNQSKAVLVYAADSGQPIVSGDEKAWRGHTDHVLTVAVSPDGQTIASGSAALDTTIHLWDASGQSLGVLPGHTTAVNDLAFSADGALLASASEDGTVRLWDVIRRQPVATLNSHTQGYAKGVAFSPLLEGSWLVSVGSDSRSRINLRQVSGPVLQAEACSLVGRNLSQAERSLFLPTDAPYHKVCEQWPEEN